MTVTCTQDDRFAKYECIASLGPVDGCKIVATICPWYPNFILSIRVESYALPHA